MKCDVQGRFRNDFGKHFEHIGLMLIKCLAYRLTLSISSAGENSTGGFVKSLIE